MGVASTVGLNLQRTAQMVAQIIADGIQIARAALVADLGHGETVKAAGIDALERFQIHVHVERQAVITGAAAYAQTD
jgi:hypothetical protein